MEIIAACIGAAGSMAGAYITVRGARREKRARTRDRVADTGD
jgi:hypothetical protein